MSRLNENLFKVESSCQHLANALNLLTLSILLTLSAAVTYWLRLLVVCFLGDVLTVANLGYFHMQIRYKLGHYQG